MNQNEILNMKPGRELDSKVAVEVMGYIWLKHLLQFSAELAVKWLGTPTDLKESCGMYIVVPNSQLMVLKERENYAEAVLHFSTEMQAASQVIVRMKELGYEYYMETNKEQGEDIYYVCFLKEGCPSGERSIGFATLPEAIVKAAFIAILPNGTL